MRVEAIEPIGAGSECFRLRLDNGTTLKVYPSVIAEMGLYPGQELPEAAMASLLDACGAASAKERAVRIISSASVSARELEERLVRKGEDAEHSRAAVQWLTDLRLLDDRQLAAQVVRNGLAKGYGAARIRQMLYEKRVPRELWDEALAELPSQDGAIDDFLRRRFRGKAPDRAECKRATDALLRRGHRWEDIRRALERYAPEEDFSEE